MPQRRPHSTSSSVVPTKPVRRGRPSRPIRPRSRPVAKLLAALGGVISLALHLEMFGASEGGWMWFGRLGGSIILAAVMRSVFGLRRLSIVITLIFVGITILISGRFGTNFLGIMIWVLAAYVVAASLVHLVRLNRRRQNHRTASSS